MCDAGLGVVKRIILDAMSIRKQCQCRHVARLDPHVHLHVRLRLAGK